MVVWRTSTHGHGLGFRDIFPINVLCHVCRTLPYNALLYIVCIFFTIVPDIHGYTTSATSGKHGTTFATHVPRTIRLNGPTSYEGVVEILVDGEWGAICDESFNDDEAEVACRQLGYDNGGYKYLTNAAFKYDTSPYDVIFYNDLYCYGYEYSLQSCTYSIYNTRDYTCYDGFSVAGVICNTEIESISSSFNFNFGWIIPVVVGCVIVSIATRRYRQRNNACGGRAVPQQTVVCNVNAQGIAVPPPRATSQAPPGSYPTQQQPPAGADLPPQYNTVLSPQGNPGVPPSAGVPSYPPQGTPYPPQSGAPYPPQGGTPYPPAQPYPQTTPYPSAPNQTSEYNFSALTNPTYPPPDNTTSPAFPPSNYTPVTNDSTPYMPPPSYESVAQDSGSQGKDNSAYTTA